MSFILWKFLCTFFLFIGKPLQRYGECDKNAKTFNQSPNLFS